MRSVFLLGTLARVLGCTQGVDYPDGDMVGMPIPLPPTLPEASAAALCDSMCSAEPACLFSSSVFASCSQPPLEWPSTLCYLKSSLVQPRNQSCRCGGAASRSQPTPPPAGAPLYTISAPHVTAVLGSRGLLSIVVDGKNATVLGDTFALALDGALLNSSALPDPVASQPDSGSAQFVFTTAPYTITVL